MKHIVTSSHRQRGVTLTELMIALVLGALVVLAATAMVVSSRSTYRTQDESTRLAESSRFGFELMNRMVRLSGYTNFGDDVFTPAAYDAGIFATWKVTSDAYSLTGPTIVGADNSKPVAGAVINNSDALVVRFFGTSSSGNTPANGGTADGVMLDCAGTPVPQPAQNPGVYASSRAYNILYVDNDVDGEPALRCRRQTYDTNGNPNGFAVDTLIRGVESFQVLYGEAIPQGLPLQDLDSNDPQAIAYRTGTGTANAVVNWENVVNIRVAMLLRSGPGALTEPEPTTKTYDLFGPRYSGGSDPGASFSLSGLSVSDRTRARRVVETTVFVRNRIGTWPSLQFP